MAICSLFSGSDGRDFISNGKFIHLFWSQVPLTSKRCFLTKQIFLSFCYQSRKKLISHLFSYFFFFMNFQRSQNWLPPCLGEKGTMGQVASWHHPENQFNIIHIILWEAVKLQLRKELWYNYAWRVSSEAAVIQLP